MRKPFAITLDPGSSLANHTGSWRTLRPEYVDRLPPCNHACPAGENIQGWLYHAESGDYERAWRLLVEENPLPAVMGRVCYHPCESACNRGRLDAAVGINSVERFLGDYAIERDLKFDPPAARSGKRVLVAAHGNSMRALVKYLDGISDQEIVGLNIPNGIPLVYELDADLKPLRHYYLGDPEAAAKAAAAVAAQA